MCHLLFIYKWFFQFSHCFGVFNWMEKNARKNILDLIIIKSFDIPSAVFFGKFFVNL